MYVVRPLSTPAEFTSRRRQHSPFDSTWGSTEFLLEKELRMVSAKNAVLELDLTEGQLRLDGRPKHNARFATGRVALAFETKEGPLRFATDRFFTWQDNVRGIALGLEALRKLDRYGIVTGEQAYTGWRQLEQKGQSSIEAEALVYDLAGVGRDISIGPAYRRARANTHPDANGGAREAWDRLELAAKQLGLA